MPNHWSDDGDLVIEDRTLFRHVGWLAYPSGIYYARSDGLPNSDQAPGGIAPLYQQIATDHGEGWED